MYLHNRIHNQRDHVRCEDRARMADKHQQPSLPSWYCRTFTKSSITFSQRWMKHDVAQWIPTPVLNPKTPPPPPRIFCMSHLVSTPDSDNQLIRSEQRARTVFLFTLSLHSVYCFILPEQENRLSLFHFGMFIHGFALHSVFTHRLNILENYELWHNIPK